MTTAQAIDALTTDPVTFLSNNIMMVSGKLSGLGVAGGVQPLTLREYNYGIGKKNGALVKVYVLAHMKDYPDGEQFNAYWCPYEQNRSGVATLHGRLGPSLSFTPLMDGCTFAAGVPAADGSRLVTHVNMASQGESQRVLQRHVASGTVGRGAGTVINEPSNYFRYQTAGDIGSKHITVTFGWRQGGNWDFFMHQYYGSKDGNDRIYNWVGCDPVGVTV